MTAPAQGATVQANDIGKEAGNVLRFSYGWYVIAVAVVVYMLVTGTTFTAFGLYVLPVSAEFKLSRADMNTALILFNLGGALTAPFVGRLLDRVSAKRIMLVSAILMGASYAILGASSSILLSAAVLALPLAVAAQGAGTVTMAVFLGRWFEAQRGRASAIAMIGTSFGSIVVAPVTALLIQELGWRTTLIATGAAVGGLLLSLSFTMRDRPGPGEVDFGRGSPSVRSAPSAAPEAPAKIGDLLSRPMFWMIAFSVALTLGMSQAIAISLVPLARGSGLTMLQAASILSISGIAGIVGKLTLAALDGKVERVWILATLFGLTALLDAALIFADTYAVLLACGLVMGFAVGAVAPAYLALLADRFGAASFGTVQGLVKLVASTLSLVAVRVAGEVFDRTGGYDLLFASFMALQLAALILMIATRFVPAGGKVSAAVA
jgi:predicted MFS family arabinose efflux permease